MQIQITAVGKLKEDYLREGIAEYLKRLTTMAKVKIIEVADEKLPSGDAEALTNRAKEAEGERILAALPKNSYHIALDMRGKNISSPELARLIEELALSGQSQLAFTIGGSVGLSKQVLDSADYLLSFGQLTYPHQLMRLMLLEQIYRALKINRGETYHK